MGGVGVSMMVCRGADLPPPCGEGMRLGGYPTTPEGEVKKVHTVFNHPPSTK